MPLVAIAKAHVWVVQIALPRTTRLLGRGESEDPLALPVPVETTYDPASGQLVKDNVLKTATAFLAWLHDVICQ